MNCPICKAKTVQVADSYRYKNGRKTRQYDCLNGHTITADGEEWKLTTTGRPRLDAWSKFPKCSGIESAQA